MAIFLSAIIYLILFFIGASIFSFLNVVAYRLPKNMQFVTGHSFCPSCEHKLTFFDTFPILSYVFLGGKCRYCKGKIPFSNTLAELCGGLAAVCCYICFEPYCAVVAFAFIAVLWVISVIDIKTMTIPNSLNIAVLCIGIVSYFASPVNAGGIADRLIGAACVSVPMLVLALVISGAFGGGDIKLMVGAGVFFGWKLTLTAMFLSLIFGSLWAVVLMAKREKGRRDRFAFGPALCLGLICTLFFGSDLLSWYLGLIGL